MTVASNPFRVLAVVAGILLALGALGFLKLPDAVSAERGSDFPAEATSWRPGDAVFYNLACNARDFVVAVAEGYEREEFGLLEHLIEQGDCFVVLDVVGRPAKAQAALDARVSRSYCMPVGCASVWSLRDAVRGAVFILLADHTGRHEAAGPA